MLRGPTVRLQGQTTWTVDHWTLSCACSDVTLDDEHPQHFLADSGEPGQFSSTDHRKLWTLPCEAEHETFGVGIDFRGWLCRYLEHYLMP